MRLRIVYEVMTGLRAVETFPTWDIVRADIDDYGARLEPRTLYQLRLSDSRDYDIRLLDLTSMQPRSGTVLNALVWEALTISSKFLVRL